MTIEGACGSSGPPLEFVKQAAMLGGTHAQEVIARKYCSRETARHTFARLRHAQDTKQVTNTTDKVLGMASLACTHDRAEC